MTLPTTDLAASGAPWPARLAAAWRSALLHLRGIPHRYPWILVFLVVYAAGRLALNLSVGISLLNALRPLLIGLFFQAAALLVIDTLYFLFYHPDEVAGGATPTKAAGHKTPWAALAVVLGTWAFWALDIIDGLQRVGAMPGTPVLGWLPGWAALAGRFLAAGDALNALLPVAPGWAYAALLSNLALRVILPLGLLWGLGFRQTAPLLTFRRWKVAAPFLLVGLVAWLAGGLSPNRLAIFGIVLLYPALTEGLLYRGWMQSLFSEWLRPGYAILLTALLFGLLHLPEYAFVRYTGMEALAFSNLGDVALTGLVWGYGVYRTRSLLPWVAFHALSDLAGL